MADEQINPKSNAPVEALFRRYRAVTVLGAVLALQLVLLGYQVQTSKDVPLIRVWAVTAVSPLARTLEFFRRNTLGFLDDYVVLTKVKEENRRLANDNARLKLENLDLRNQVSLSSRVGTLVTFQQKTASKTIVASVINTSTNLSANVVYVDRGSVDGLQSGMAVITPEGIVGKTVKVFPTSAQVLLLTDQGFSASVVSSRGKTQGILRGQGENDLCRIDFVQSDVDIQVGDVLYTSGSDRVFPKGFPVGKVARVEEKGGDKQVYVAPLVNQGSLEEVLIVLQGVHGALPGEETPVNAGVYIGPPVPGSPSPAPAAPTGTSATPASANPPAAQEPPPSAPAGALRTEADRLLDKYRKIGEAQNHTYGAGGVPNFNIKVDDKTKLAPPPPETRTAVGGPFVPLSPGQKAPAPGQIPPVTPAKPNPGQLSTPKPQVQKNEKPAAKPAAPPPPVVAPTPTEPAKPKYIPPKVVGAEGPGR